MSVENPGSDIRIAPHVKYSKDAQCQISANRTLLSSVGRSIDCSHTVRVENAISPLHTTTHPNKDTKASKHWLNLKENLTSLANRRNSKGFDEAFVRYLQSYSRHGKYAISTKYKGAVFAPERKQYFIPEACYALKTMFSLRSNSEINLSSGPAQSRLCIDFFPPNIFRWLVNGNYLNPELLLKALQPREPNPESAQIIQDGDIIKAVIAHNSDLFALSIILENPLLLSILDTTLAVKAIITALEVYQFHDISDLYGDKVTNRQDLESEMSRQEEAACSDIDRGLATLEAGFDMCGLMLHRALTRLHSFPSFKVTQYLREYFSRYEIVSLLQLLRVEITEGGWILRYSDIETSKAENFTPDEQAVGIILGLMSSVINALGIAGWLIDSTEKHSDGSGKLLLALQAELSRVLEGVTEATFMAGLLDEFLRYGKRRRVKPKCQNGLQMKQPIEKFQKAEDALIRQSSRTRLLPLGLGASVLSQETKKGIRGELKKRSKRDIGMQLSMKRARYSRDIIQL